MPRVVLRPVSPAAQVPLNYGNPHSQGHCLTSQLDANVAWEPRHCTGTGGGVVTLGVDMNHQAEACLGKAAVPSINVLHRRFCASHVHSAVLFFYSHRSLIKSFNLTLFALGLSGS